MQRSAPSRAPVSLDLTVVDAAHLRYFQTVCAPEFSLFYQSEKWADIVLRASWTDRSFRRIALAIGALSRSRYESHVLQGCSVHEYALQHYNLAIREISQLDDSPQNLLRIVLTSIALITLEFLLENYDRVQFHLRSAMPILGAIHQRFEPESTVLVQALAYIQEMVSSTYWVYSGYAQTSVCTSSGLLAP